MQENQTIVIGTLQEVMSIEELPKITKQTIIIETKSKWPKKIALDLFGDKIEKFNKEFKEGDLIKCFVNIQSREYNEKWYTNVTLWKAEKYQEELIPETTNDEVPF
tara:strand:+ start:2104 stop:2421 length:318 start_codon:yes stop_codon:yes gene_type:complete